MCVCVHWTLSNATANTTAALSIHRITIQHNWHGQFKWRRDSEKNKHCSPLSAPASHEQVQCNGAPWMEINKKHIFERQIQGFWFLLAIAPRHDDPRRDICRPFHFHYLFWTFVLHSTLYVWNVRFHCNHRNQLCSSTGCCPHSLSFSLCVCAWCDWMDINGQI